MADAFEKILTRFCKLLQKLADEYLRQKRYIKSADSYEKALEYFRELKNRKSEALILHNLGFVNGKQNDKQKAREFYEQAATVYRETKNADGEASVKEISV